MAKTQRIVVGPSGVTEFIHSDAAVALLAPLGDRSTRRASHVEPWPDLKPEAQQRFIAANNPPDIGALANLWFADLGPVNGPVTGPFQSKQEALDYEVDWLHANVLGKTASDATGDIPHSPLA